MMRVGIFLYALVVALMVGASSWLGEREIVFPEVAANTTKETDHD